MVKNCVRRILLSHLKFVAVASSPKLFALAAEQEGATSKHDLEPI